MARFETLEAYIPISLSSPIVLFYAFFILMAFIVGRYFLMVGSFWAYYYKWLPSRAQEQLQQRLIYPKLPSAQQQWFEIKWSMVSAVIFAGTGLLLGVMWEQGWTQIYLRFDEYGWFYFFISPILFMFIQDTYFYWTHRWLHIPSVFKKYHYVHHESLNPSPWASFSFHPTEALINAIALPLIAVVLPLHPTIILFQLVVMTVTAILNHLGYETLPKWALKSGLARWWISGLHHAQHHRQFNTNYALFFSFWDHWMGTENKNFLSEINRILGEKPITEGLARKSQPAQVSSPNLVP